MSNCYDRWFILRYFKIVVWCTTRVSSIPDLFGIFPLFIVSSYSTMQVWYIYGFADDHQLLKSFLPIFQVQALDGDVNHCFKSISDWMQEHFLCLNASKTKILIVKPTTLKEEIQIGGTLIDGNCVRFVTSAKNLAIDEELSFEQQVTTVVKSCYIIIRKISKIKSFLSVEHLNLAHLVYFFQTGLLYFYLLWNFC